MTNRFAIAHIHTTGPNTERDFIIQLGVLPLDGKNRPIIQRFKPECSLSRSSKERSGLKDKDLSTQPLFGTVTDDWKNTLSFYDTLFILKTGNGDELSWMRKVVLDHELDVEIIDLGRVIQYFVPGIKEHSFQGLYKKYLKKQFKPGKGLMSETLQLGENLLREIIYLFSDTSTTFDTYLIDLIAHVPHVPELRSVFNLTTTCKISGWMADDLLAQQTEIHDDFDISKIEGEHLLGHLLPEELGDMPKMKSNEDDITEIRTETATNFFDSDFIKQKLHRYEKRDSQVTYAEKVVRTLNEPIHNYVEAPTGIGKSLGYLVPSGLFLEKNPKQKVLIATSTKNLQNQIIERDWNLIKARFPDIRIALLKGKSNYICVSALARQFHHAFTRDVMEEEKAAWFYLALFCHQTDGDIENIPYSIKQWLVPIIDLLKDVQANLHCTKDQCIPSGCIYGKHLMDAEQAHIIITNHHKCVLLNEGLLGTTRLIIVDEAERFGDNVRHALSTQIDSKHYKRLLYRLLGKNKQRGFLRVIQDRIHHLSKSTGKKAKAAHAAKDIIESLIAGVEQTELVFKQFLQDIYPENGRVPPLMQHLPALRNSKDSIAKGLQPVVQSLSRTIDGFVAIQSADVPLQKRIKQRCESYRVLIEELYNGIKEFTDGTISPKHVHHFKGHPNRSWMLIKIPVDITDHLNDTIYKDVGHLFFTSATLCVDGNAAHFINDNGSNSANEDVEQDILPQVFDYGKNTVCHIDTSITSYNYRDEEIMDAYRGDVNRAICAYSLAANGRTLVLFTSSAELEQSFDRAAPFFQAHDLLPLRQNGSSLEEIREFNRNEFSVLFGVDRFWSGVDFPGSTLSQVIITKAPNPALSDPLIAHHRLWDATFMEKKYPFYGRLKLKQGFGRLVRSMSDKGGVIILDSRYANFPRFYCHLDELPLQVTFSSDQESIMRSILNKAKLKTEFHERRIDPFLETEQFDLSAKAFSAFRSVRRKHNALPTGVKFKKVG